MATQTLPATVSASVVTLDVTGDTPTTTSLDIARHFGKPHFNVLRDIEVLLGQLPGERKLNFEFTFTQVPGPNGAVRKDPAYRITRDGFTLLAMSFTGAKALKFKLAYIDAFNKMEKATTKQAPNILDNIDPSRVIYLGPKGDISLAGMYVAAVDAKFIGVQAAAKKYGITAGFLERILNLRSKDLSKLGAQAQTGLGEMIADGLKWQLKLERTPTTAIEGKY